jgi:peptidoglycan-associated lipoprotein
VNSKKYTLFVASMILSVFVLTGCPPKKKMAIDEKPKEEVLAADDSLDADGLGVRITSDWTEIPALSVVTFAYDSAQLTSAGREQLKNNVSLLKKLPASVVIRVEGHCDERGTIEYNIALGQRRANAISNFYATSGIARNRLQTISFGEERPLCTQATEACWAQNRRGATKVRNDSPITFTPEELQ